MNFKDINETTTKESKKKKKPQQKVHKIMKEFKKGILKSGTGAEVTSREQAIAIALKTSGLSKYDK